MALILIFVGSFIGIIAATVQMLFQDASLWQGIGIYLAISVGFPAITLFLAFSLHGRHAEQETDDEYSWRKA